MSEREMSAYQIGLGVGRGRERAAQRERLARAWDEGVQAALSHAVRQDDGVTLRLDMPNPYREAGK